MQRMAEALKLAASSLRERVVGEKKTQSLAQLAHSSLNRAHRSAQTIGVLRAELHLRRTFTAWAAALSASALAARHRGVQLKGRCAAAAGGRPQVRHLAAAQPSRSLVLALARAACVAWRGYAIAVRQERHKTSTAVRSMRRLRAAMQRLVAERVLRAAWMAWRGVVTEVRARGRPRLESPKLQRQGHVLQAQEAPRQRSHGRSATAMWHRGDRPVPAT